MGLENLSSVFNDISKNEKLNRVKEARSGDIPPENTQLKTQVNDTNLNILDKIDRIDIRGDSPVGNLALKADNFTSLPFFEGNIEFKNKSQQLIGGTSFIDDDIKHNFGFTIFDDISKIEKIEFRDPDSPQTKRPSPDFQIQFGQKRDENVDKRKDDLFQNLGENNRLGQGNFIFDSLYRVNHRAVGLGDRVAIPTGQTYMLNGQEKQVEINTLRSGMGDLSLLQPGSKPSLRVGRRGFSRGDEPYITKDIGSNTYSIGVNRDGLPFNRIADDVSRILNFYGSDKGLVTIGKDLFLGGFYGVMGTPLPKELGTYSGGFGGNTKSLVINPLLGPLRALAMTANSTRLLQQNILAPTLLSGQNTGFLNFYGQAIQSPGIPSLRKPFAQEYSTLVKSGNDALSKISQLQFSKGVIDLVEGQDYEDPLIPSVFPFPSNAKEYGTRTITDGDKENVFSTPFLGLGGGTQSPYGDDNAGHAEYTAVDHIAKTGVEEGAEDFFTGETVPPLEDTATTISEGDFYVRIRDMRDDTFIYFRGFVTGITENINPSFTPTNYIGRSEPVYLYERAERDISFNLKLYPNNNEEFKLMYEKINKLTSLAYPEYMAENDQSSLMRMKAPFTQLYMGHIGTQQQGQFGFIKSITYTVNESGDWDVVSMLPRLFDVAISYQILNKKPSSMTTEFYPARLNV